jgi:hypothetical protein
MTGGPRLSNGKKIPVGGVALPFLAELTSGRTKLKNTETNGPKESSNPLGISEKLLKDILGRLKKIT